MTRASGGATGAGCQFGGRVGRACVAASLAIAMTAASGAKAAGPGAGGAKQRPEAQPLPWVTISLSSLGVPAVPDSFLQIGASMLTLDVVDDTHLLVTFSTRGLVPRIKGDPPDEEGRMVAAELVELPSGRVVERTEWHLHDHSRYLWRLGKGRFLVRSRHDLFLLTPEARLNTDDPLERVQFPVREGMPVAAFVSPEKNMLTVETVMPHDEARLEMTSSNVLANEDKPEVMIDFFRLQGGDEPGSKLTVSPSGTVAAHAPMVLPMDGDGYLWPEDGQRGHWPVSFNEFGGREVKVGAVDSSCEPRLQMVSRFEYLAFTCMATGDRSRVKAYGMDGHETWEDSLGGTFGIPEFAFAPQAGRFAMSRISSPGAIDELGFGNALPPEATQEVRVYQTESGDLLLKVPTTPVTRFAENFDLSEDGLAAAVVRDGAVEVYRLPPPSKQDVKDLAVARSFCPPESDAPVRFAKLEQAEDSEDSGAEDGAATEVKVGGAALKPAADARVAAPTAAAASDRDAAGDPAPAGDGETVRRKPPTLLGPGETVETVKGSGQAAEQQPK